MTLLFILLAISVGLNVYLYKKHINKEDKTTGNV